ncbi:hypothetical protein AXK58_14330 [Tsukamurella tyrosinosolvens]|nr:hypothetical protein AXK58_14330 [Tsukamurella tyrosinosolvens]
MATLIAAARSQPAEQRPPGRVMLTAQEVAERLHLSKGHVYSLVRQGEVASVKIGRRVLISEDALEEFLDRSTSPAHY